MTKDEMQAEITRLKYEVDAIPAIKAERDQLQKDLNAELSGNAKLREIIGAKGGETMFEFANRFVAERDALMSASKLALDVCLDMRRYGDQRGVAMAIGAEAALRQAGVQ